MNFVHSGSTFFNLGLRYPARPDISHCAAKKPIATDRNTLVKKRLVRPIPPKDRNMKDWTAIAWPTNIQSRKPDGKFGPAIQMQGWNDCWFLATLGAMANDQDGNKMLAASIKKVSAEGTSGYHITFAGSPNNIVFISDQELNHCLDTYWGDADTRLMELAANKFFSANGNFKSMFISSLMSEGMVQELAEQCLQQFCQSSGIQDPMTHNPMFLGGHDSLACFMLTGRPPDFLTVRGSTRLHRSEIMAYLNRYVTNDRDGVSVVINGFENPLGETTLAKVLVFRWDVIRTDITRNGNLGKQQRLFLNALSQWLETPDDNTLQALRSAAENLRLQHINPVEFVDLLDRDQIFLRQHHRDILRSGVQEVLAGGPGYIGFTGAHCGTLEGINEAANTFTYSEPHFPTVVHTGELSSLIREIENDNVWLGAFEPTIERKDRKLFEHAGQKKARQLRQIYDHVVKDGKIDPAESAPLADLIEMDDSAFWHVYDSDYNGVIEGGELQAVKLRVDRWVDHLGLTPIW